MLPRKVLVVQCSASTTTVDGAGEVLADYDYILRAFGFFEDAPIVAVPLPDPHVTSPEVRWPARELAERLAGTKRRTGAPLGAVECCVFFKRDMSALFAQGSPRADEVIRELDVRNPWPPGAIVLFVVGETCHVGLLAAVDYLMMSNSDDFTHRRAYVLAPHPEPESDAPPRCLWVGYRTGEPCWQLDSGVEEVGEYKPYRSASEAKVVPRPATPPLPRRPEILPNGPEMGPGYDAYRLLARERHSQPFPAMIPNPKAPIRIEPGDRAFTGAIFADPKSGW